MPLFLKIPSLLRFSQFRCGFFTQMPSNWNFKQADQELGSYTFRYIIEMIREKTPTSEVLVRPCNADQWPWANSVVSLFHMARRDPATLPPVKNAVEEVGENKDGSVLEAFISSPDEPVNQTEFKVVEEVEKPGLLKRLLSLRSSKTPAVPLDPNRNIHIDLSRPVLDDSILDTLKDRVDFESENQIELAGVDEIGTDEESNSNINDIGFCDGRVQFITQSSNGKVYASLASLQSQSLDGMTLAQ